MRGFGSSDDNVQERLLQQRCPGKILKRIDHISAKTHYSFSAAYMVASAATTSFFFIPSIIPRKIGEKGVTTDTQLQEFSSFLTYHCSSLGINDV